MKLSRTVHLLSSFALATALISSAHAQQAPVAGPPGAASHAIQAAPMPLTEDEALPPTGKGNLFSDAQVRYCLAQLIRVDAIRPLLNRYEREEVEQFNALVADFNARCGGYRYKDNALAEAKAWLEANRAQIERAARENYMTRFPGESKVATAPKNPGAAAPAHATSEDKPAQPIAKAAPEAKPASTAKPPTETAKPAVRPPPPPAIADKPAHTVNKSEPDLSASEPPGAGPAADASKPPAPSSAHPRTGRDDKPAAATKPPAPSAKPKDIASTAADAAMRPGGARPAPGAAADVSITAAPAAEAIRAEPLISKPKEFPSESVTQRTATTPTDSRPPQSASTPPEDKAAKPPDKPSSAAPATAESAAKPQPEEREPATRPGARKSAKPATKPPHLPASPARKTEPPPAQVAAVAPKPEPPPPTPEAALARLTQEIQRAGSQVLPQPAGASESGTDLTTQVEVRYASGGWVRSIVVGESSGSTALDEQALALARATRFPDVPESLRSREFAVRFPVIFRAAR
jgi:TonB family protein